jgi:hypothetical protein
MMSVVAAWLILALIIAFLGRGRRFGFWGYLFASILLTPVIGLLLLIAAIPVSRPQPRHPARR